MVMNCFIYMHSSVHILAGKQFKHVRRPTIDLTGTEPGKAL
jgi:hypothetical protein